VNRRNILIVVNQLESYQKLARSLQKYGYHPYQCLSGEVALKYVNREPPDFILAEMNLADMEGIKLCWLVRETSKAPTIPFVLVTDTKDDEVKINGLRSGVDAFIKPNASARELITLIEALFKRMEQFQSQSTFPRKSLIGNIPDFSLLEIIQLLHLSKKTGVLTLFNEKNTGKIALIDGNLSWAEMKFYEGETAIVQMLEWKPARFEFERDVRFEKMNIQRSTMEVILNCTAILDEKMAIKVNQSGDNSTPPKEKNKQPAGEESK